MPQIEVSFDIDANGILNVQAKDLATGKQQSIVIQAGTGLDEQEIEKMKQDAEEHAEEDRKQRELVDARNAADQLIYQTEKSFKEVGDALSDSDRQAVEDARKRLEEAVKTDDIQAIRQATQAFQEAAQRVGQALYEKVARERAADASGPEAAADASAGPEAPPGSGEEVIDADYEVKE